MYSGRIVEHAEAKEFFAKTRHPYSIALINSLPGENSKTKLKTIIGAPPNIQEKITGCKFHPRCDFAESGVCDIDTPDLEEKAKDHFIACFKV